MYKGLYISTSGSAAQEMRLDMITNNIANVNNNGYKKSIPAFESFLPKEIVKNDTAYVAASAEAIDYTQGPLVQTGDPLNIAIEGKGFFAVSASDGTTMYTRKGEFSLDKNRRLITQDGKTVLGSGGEITLPKADSVIIDEKGKILAITGKEVSAVNALRIVNMAEPYPLEDAGNGLLRATSDIKEEESNFKETSVRQGFLEGSNVSAVTELVAMIEVSRAYESYQKIMRTIDDINARAVSEIARV